MRCRPLVKPLWKNRPNATPAVPSSSGEPPHHCAYARVKVSQVTGADTKRQLTDLVALVRFAIGLDTELKPFRDQVDRRFQEWIFRHNAKRTTAFSTEQTEWLRLMKDHIASSCSITRDDFE